MFCSFLIFSLVFIKQSPSTEAYSSMNKIANIG